MFYHFSDACDIRDEKPVHVTPSTNIQQPTATTTQGTEKNGNVINFEMNANFRLGKRRRLHYVINHLTAFLGLNLLTIFRSGRYTQQLILIEFAVNVLSLTVMSTLQQNK